MHRTKVISYANECAQSSPKHILWTSKSAFAKLPPSESGIRVHQRCWLEKQYAAFNCDTHATPDNYYHPYSGWLQQRPFHSPPCLLHWEHRGPVLDLRLSVEPQNHQGTRVEIKCPVLILSRE